MITAAMMLDESIEKGLHDFEEFYTDCTIDRLYDPSKDDCPSVSCSNVNVDLADAVTTLELKIPRQIVHPPRAKIVPKNFDGARYV